MPKGMSVFSGGESGIRTHEEVAPLPLFESGAFNHSAISPLGAFGQVCSAPPGSWRGQSPRPQMLAQNALLARILRWEICSARIAPCHLIYKSGKAIFFSQTARSLDPLLS